MENKYSKILILIASIGFIMWFGGSILRSAIAYDLFEPAENFVLKSKYNDEIKMHSIYIYSTLAVYTNVAYGFAFFAILFITILHRKHLRQKGWFFMSLILFYLFSTVEVLKIYYDAKLSWGIYYDNIMNFNDPLIKTYFISRFQNILFNTFSSLSFFANLTIIIFLIWKPLDKKD